MQYNYQDENLYFLKTKIQDIKIAMFKSEINIGLQLPNNIIQTLKVEDDGTIWFFTSCSGNHAELDNKSFYAYLNYYKKGTGCRLQVSGKASIVDKEDDTLFPDSNYSKGTYSRLALVKLKMMQAEYFENKDLRSLSWTDKIKNSFDHLFMTPTDRVYDFS